MAPCTNPRLSKHVSPSFLGNLHKHIQSGKATMLESQRVAIASISLGWHESFSLEEKIHAASSSGYKGIEIVHSDLQKEATSRSETIEQCAEYISQLCRERNLGVVTLASFDNYEGSPLPLVERLEEALRWVNLARILQADSIQVPASYDHASLAVSEDAIVDELRLLADCGMPRSGRDEATITVAYEPMSWSVRTDTWEHAIYIKRRVARSNFKLCLDTYHILTKLWGDCTVASGRIPNGDLRLEESLHGFLRQVQPDDVAFVQLSDVERMDPPVSFNTLRKAGKHYAWYWCSWGRLFPLEAEEGAYLPMIGICRAWLVDLGWTGWVSMETFHRKMTDEKTRPDHWAERGMKSWNRLKQAISQPPNSEGQARSKL
ncbi:putative AP endonuclease, family 2 [Polychaeton citri CBS 116435]|uniref:AP endonuclease, family 2 n=1 Tax=Polychaeton citri CBS 116435 TaxID=1314669 RepID=A0A9P4PZH8_9PEZI|nr:putative AP endonuclease, family 2 [Polychaeton citri CBS 116435]